MEFRQHPGDDARGRNEGDAAQQYGRKDSPAEEKTANQPRRKVEQKVDGAGGQAAAKILAKLRAGVFQPQHEQEQEHADLGTNLDEVFGELQRRQATVAKRKSGEQVERYGRKSPAAGEARENSQPDSCRAKLDEDLSKVVWGKRTQAS